ncbi:hypothetical protein DVA43_21445 [Leclercia sp. W6]|uniref:phage baseplate protein n=1 Tax=Leclercia sp. W6 TaxID=2282310 RepID=UPI000DF24E74|nr:hypothetical protein DVA43_21445 [Leclercia sp. W6]
MSQTVITQAFEALKAQEAANHGVVTLDEFVFASVPNLNITDPISRTETLPPAAQIVHRQAVSKTGMVNSNAVVYSVVLGADVGDFEFNWVGLLNKASGAVAMIVHAPSQKKIKTASGQQGNVLTRSFLMEYNGASTQTNITTPADTWQIDFTARLNGVDERIRLENIDTYGAASFLKDGFLVSGANGNYQVKKGVAYIEGLRAELLFDQAVAVAKRPSKIWVDVCWRGTLTSVWATATKITVADTLANYVTGDEQHYVFAIANILADGSVIDLRQASVMAQVMGWSAMPDTVPYFDKDSKLKTSAISDFGREMLAVSDAQGALSGLGLTDPDQGDTGVSVRQPFTGAVARTQHDKNAEAITPQDAGAKGDGKADDTAAFDVLEAGVTGQLIDLGGKIYNVAKPYYKNQYTNGSFVIDGSLHPASFDLNALRYKKICATFYTGDVDIPGQTPIFDGAAGVFQAFCLVPANGQVKMYVTQRATGPLPFLGNFLKNETYRIVEYTFKEDGSQILSTAFSQPLTTCGHANMLGYRYEGSELYFYTGAPNDSETDTTLGGKGFTRVHWKGSATSDSDVTRYEMFDQPTTIGGVYNTHCRTNVTVSPDGKYLLLVTDDTMTGDHAALIYDLDTVLASTNLKSLVPLHEFRVPSYYSSPLQGIAMNDKYVFVYYDWEVNTSALKIFDFAGNLVSDIDNIDFLRTVHTRDEYLGGFGVLTTFESENVTLFGNDLYVGYREIWYEMGTIVSYDGKFYTPRAATTGNPPNNSAYWMPVNISTGAVPYSATAAYTVTGAKKANLKRVVKIGALKESSSVPIQGRPGNPTGPKLRDPNLRYIANSGSFQWERWEENTKRFLTTLRVSEAGNWYFHDSSPGAAVTPGVMLSSRSNEVAGVTTRYARIRGGDNYGGNTFWYAADDSNKPGSIVEYVGANNTTSRETNQYGETVIKSNTDASKVPLRADVQGTGDFIRGSRYDTVYFGIRTSTVNTIMTSRSGNSFILGASSSVDGFTSDTTARVNINITDMAFRPDADNNLDNGKVNYRWKQLFATNSSIGTSDETHKTRPRNIALAEVTAFAAIARLPSVWQWLSKYQVEGDDARLHAGPTVQAAIAIMEANGLDWSRYSAFCYDEWENQYEPVLALRKVEKEIMVEREGFEYPEWVEVDEEYDTGEKVLIKPAGSVYSFRKEELLWWCLRAMVSQFDDLDARMLRLESVAE